ncbi:peptidoglycan editing factor PgeF [Photobacterium sanguinicancri]|uniref:peptidoglycan editing factor PgeF n=1 Tax=Photobacterium sanguinicancri TaxID=875932 RepID=UPI0021C293A8|nr:peptidoglycan editing factor PgeF [Photobacterium sanguinicancri]
MMTTQIIPDWPAPTNVKAISTTRVGGTSVAPYQSFNLGLHVGDDPLAVCHHRDSLQQQLQLPSSPAWLNQTHSTTVLTLTKPLLEVVDADGSYTQQSGIACTVMTADCLPVLLCDKAGTQVAAVHAGWRGLVDGIIEQALALFNAPSSDILVWLGPAIGPQQFEVGEEVRQQFMAVLPEAECAFTAHGEKWLADIYQLARQRLCHSGITHIYGGEHCTVTESDTFFSYRRDGVTGRQASLIWIE